MLKKSERKIISVLVCVVTLFVLSGCRLSERSENTDAMVIRFVGNPGMPVENNSGVEQYLEQKYHIELDCVSVTSNYTDKLATMFASNDIPDVMFSNEAAYWKAYADQNLIAPLDIETIKTYAPRHYAYINEYDERLWKLCEYKDKLYAIPKTMGNEYNTVMVWRKDWLDAVGISKIPETIEECEEAFIRFRNNDPDGNGIKDTYGLTGLGGSPWRQFDIYFGAYGIMPGQWGVQNGEIVNYTICDTAKEALALLHRWYEMELIDPELITDTVETVGKKFNLGRIGVMNTGLGNVSDKTAKGQENLELIRRENPDSSLKIVYGNLPAGPEGKRGDWLWGPCSNFVVFGTGMEHQPEKLGIILTMLDEINYNPETAIRVIYGEKGRTYTYNDDAAGPKSGIKFLPPYDLDSSARAKEGIGTGGFFNLFSPAGGDWADSKIVKQYTPDEYIKENELYANLNNYRDALMRVTLPSEIRYSESLERIKTTAYSAFVTGHRSLDEWDDFVNEYLDNGGRVLYNEAVEYYNQNLK